MTVKGCSGGAMGVQWRGHDNGDDGDSDTGACGGSGSIGSGVGGIEALGGGDT